MAAGEHNLSLPLEHDGVRFFRGLLVAVAMSCATWIVVAVGIALLVGSPV